MARSWKPWQKNLVSGFVILAGGYVLFYAAFLLAAAVHGGYLFLLRALGALPQGPGDAMIAVSWHYIFILLVLLLAWLVLRTKARPVVKATFFTMPLLVVLVEIGFQLYQTPHFILPVAGAFVVAVGICLYKMKVSWHYWFALFYVTAIGLFIQLTGMEI